MDASACSLQNICEAEISSALINCLFSVCRSCDRHHYRGGHTCSDHFLRIRKCSFSGLNDASGSIGPQKVTIHWQDLILVQWRRKRSNEAKYKGKLRGYRFGGQALNDLECCPVPCKSCHEVSQSRNFNKSNFNFLDADRVSPFLICVFRHSWDVAVSRIT